MGQKLLDSLPTTSILDLALIIPTTFDYLDSLRAIVAIEFATLQRSLLCRYTHVIDQAIKPVIGRAIGRRHQQAFPCPPVEAVIRSNPQLFICSAIRAFAACLGQRRRISLARTYVGAFGALNQTGDVYTFDDITRGLLQAFYSAGPILGDT